MRCGILPIRIETGRYVNLPEENRTCELCNTGEIENEKHFLCICNVFSKWRANLYCSINNNVPHFTDMSNDDKFDYLMKFEQIKASKFVLKCYEYRKSLMYT